MTVTQRIFDNAGGYRDVLTAAVMFFGEDGHNHWHVQDLQDFELYRFDNGKLVGQAAKRGFCFFDNYKDGVYPIYDGPYKFNCGSKPEDTQVSMGLTPGWGDIYAASIGTGQYIDITGSTPGRYRFYGVADKDDWFEEKDETNNSTSVDVVITNGGKVTVEPSA